MDEKRETGAWASAYGTLGINTGIRMLELPLHILDPWQGKNGEMQPFRVYTPEKLQDLADNIRANGVIEAIRVRPQGERFQILAGHNRCKAAEMAGLLKIPAIVEDVDDDQAVLIMLDSNLQHREQLLPSEKARAYQMRLNTIKRQAGRPSQNYGQVVHNFEGQTSRDILAEESGESGRQVQRFIRLNSLRPALLDMVDSESIGVTTGVDISFLSVPDQDRLIHIMGDNNIQKITGAQAKKLRQAKIQSDGDIEEILGLSPAPPKPPTVKITLDLSDYPDKVVKQLKRDKDFQAAMQNAMEQYIHHLLTAET